MYEKKLHDDDFKTFLKNYDIVKNNDNEIMVKKDKESNIQLTLGNKRYEILSRDDCPYFHDIKHKKIEFIIKKNSFSPKILKENIHYDIFNTILKEYFFYESFQYDRKNQLSKKNFYRNFEKYEFILINTREQQRKLLDEFTKYHISGNNNIKKEAEQIYMKNRKENFKKVPILNRDENFYYNIKYNENIIGTLSIYIDKKQKEIIIHDLSINKIYRKQNHLLYIFYFVYHTFMNQYRNSINGLKDFSIILHSTNEKVGEHYQKYGFYVIKTENFNKMKLKTMEMDKNFYRKFDIE